jgi:Tol biopolymer transport system component
MSEPKTPLGRLLAEQARQDIPEDLDGWPQILNRLQGFSGDKARQPQNALHIPQIAINKGEVTGLSQDREAAGSKPAAGEATRKNPVALKRRRGLALVGLGLAAALALFLIAASVLLSGNKGSPPVVSDATKAASTSQAALPGSTTAPASPTAPPTPYVASELGYIPQDCGPAPVLQELSPDIAAMAGGNPVGMVGFDTQGGIPLYEARPTQWGYSAKVIWTIAPSFSGVINIQGSNLKTGRPLRFDISSKVATTLTLDPSKNFTSKSGWYFWPSEVYAPEAGCYRFVATWPGGSWTVTVGAGKATIPNSTPLPTVSAGPPAPTATPTPQTIAGLTVNGANFSKQGKLAFVSNGNLFVLDGATGQTRQLTTSGGVSEFKWSYDGEWLAYRANFRGAAGPVLVAHYNGIENFPLPGVGEFAWSPVTNEIALTSPDGGLQIVNTAGIAHKLTGQNATSPLWSPDGSTIAFVTAEAGRDGPAKIVTMPAIGGSTTPYFTGKAGDGIKLLSWWPNGKGLLFQTIPVNSASLSANGLPVESIDLTSSQNFHQTLVKSLVNTNWLSWSPDGTKFVAVEGTGRQLTANKSLTICDITKNSCQTVAQPANTVSLDPAWSSDGTQIAFVSASSVSGFSDETAYINWLKTNTLWLVNADGSNARQIDGLAAFGGLENPLWSADGKKLLLADTSGNGKSGLWLADLTEQNGKVQAAVHPVVSPVGNPSQTGNIYFSYQDLLVGWYRK